MNNNARFLPVAALLERPNVSRLLVGVVFQFGITDDLHPTRQIRKKEIARSQIKNNAVCQAIGQTGVILGALKVGDFMIGLSRSDATCKLSFLRRGAPLVPDIGLVHEIT